PPRPRHAVCHARAPGDSRSDRGPALQGSPAPVPDYGQRPGPAPRSPGADGLDRANRSEAAGARMRLLVRFYPHEWRRRYGAERQAFLSQTRLGPREVVDLLRGALDAHVHPQWPRRGRSPVMWALLGLLVFLAGVPSRWLVVTLGLAVVAALVAIGD